MTSKYILFFDDTGNRNPDKSTSPNRMDRMDCFGLGGILVKEEHLGVLVQRHKEFCAEWRIDYPLHSTKIRGARAKFGWLEKPENARFLHALQEFLLSLPIIGIACVVHRPGYSQRYRDRYKGDLWYMCKTTFCILVERSAKFADEEGRSLEIYFEESGRYEDSDIIQYMRNLKKHGNPFDQDNSKDYRPLAPEDYRRIILGEPQRSTKKSPFIQIADLILYPIAKAGYDPNYPPYRELKKHKKLVDCFVQKDQILHRGSKYSCFDYQK